MSLPGVDKNWYCEDCDLNFEYCDKPDFLFCPNCGKVLKNDMYQKKLKYVIESLKNLGKSVCDECLEEFDLDYNFCPVCSNKLRKEIIKFKVEIKDNSIYAEWNGENVCIFDRDEFIDNPHFPCEIDIECFRNKSSLDEQLEFDFKKIGKNPPQKLTYREAYSIYKLGNEIHIIEFTSKPDENILKNDERGHDKEIYYVENERFNRILKLRDDLYVKLMIIDIKIMY